MPRILWQNQVNYYFPIFVNWAKQSALNPEVLAWRSTVSAVYHVQEHWEVEVHNAHKGGGSRHMRLRRVTSARTGPSRDLRSHTVGMV